ncbi:MAG: DUF1365 domain-containing protein [Desulfobacterales bacterium]
MKPALYVGAITHQRFIPRNHRFRYPFFMWYLNLDEIDRLPDMGHWFSARRFALSRFYRPDYLDRPAQPLHARVKSRMQALTGVPVDGQVGALVNLRTLGLYFSPVNFYFGFDRQLRLTHFLAEVSNIPWNERHLYGHYLGDGRPAPTHAKAFHVSPFNPRNQYYRWQITRPGKRIRIGIAVHDARGQVFEARLDLARRPFNLASVKRQLLGKPVMTGSIVAAIHWQALRLYHKGVPYVPYPKEMT